tara:strand:- start:1456 stop:2226 length:771 start_codon:yes stop_codon:yes gene_type:complete
MMALRAAFSLLLPLILVALWFCLSNTKGADISYIVNPLAAWQKIVLLHEELIENTILSLERLAVGVVVGSVLGIIAGIMLGRRPWLRRFFGPTLNVLTAIPIIVLIPFFFLVFGFGELFRISVVAAIVFLLVYQAVFSSVFSFPRRWLELAAHREKSEWQIIWQMLLPSVLPEIMRAIRLSLLFGWLAIALAEKAVAVWPRGGLGYQILRAKEQGLYEELFAAVIVLGTIAWLLDVVFGGIVHAVSYWREESGRIR